MQCMLPQDWDNWLCSQRDRAGFCQSSAWARIHRELNGSNSYAISVNRDGQRVAGALVTLRVAALNNLGFGDWLRLRLAGQAGGTLECFEGPVLPDGNLSECLADVLSQVGALAKRLGVNQIRFAGAPPVASWAGSEEADRIFRKFGYGATDWLTSIIDLLQDEEILRRNLKQAARKGIRKSLEAGLTVSLCNSYDQFIGSFCKAYYESTGVGEITSVISRNEAFWRADIDRAYRFFVVEDRDGNIHATLGTYRYQGVVTEIMSGRTDIGKSSNLPAQDLLHWEAMLFHKREGDHYFNLAGYSPHPATEKEAGIRRFKEKWGGREVAVPSYTWTNEPGYARAARWLRAKAGLE